MGHSMGGGIALSLASTPKYEDLMPDISGWLLESPYIALPKAAEPNALTVFIGRLAGKLLPHMHITHKIPSANVTRDPAVMKSIEEDELCFNVGTLETLSGMLDRAGELEHGKCKLNKGVRALWISHGTADKATDFSVSEKYCKEQTTVEDRTFKPYDGWSHQLHADLPETRAIFAKDVGDWILARSGSTGGKPAEQAKL
jgi:acylglycerol lipase